ncbi:MAG: response regulator [Lachnospiraceae bacterium]
MRMIIADDEPVITNGIQKLINWNELGFEIVGVYTDGKAALEGMISQKPDLALLDISMPFLTGIDIITKCNDIGLKTRIIFISGFQDFEYAKNAIKYGAIDYLLKPIIREELMNAVERFYSFEKPESGHELLPELAIQPIHGEMAGLYELEDTNYVPIYAEIMFPENCTEQMKRLVQFSFKSFMEDYLETKNLGIIFLREEQVAIILKGLDGHQVRDTILTIRDRIKETISYQISFIIGEEVEEIQRIPASYQECIRKKEYLFFDEYLPEAMVSVRTGIFDKNIDAAHFEVIKANVLSEVISQKHAELEKDFGHFKNMVCKISEGRKEDACYYTCSFLNYLDEKTAHLRTGQNYFDIKELLSIGRSCSAYSKMMEIYFQEIMRLSRYLGENSVSEEKKNILAAKKYIEEHFFENISLHVMAEQVHMNPYYFSTFFKKHSGENFKDYLNQIRVEKSIPMLLNTSKKTYEIAIEVGFTDARTFSEVFQRYHGETPNAYRKRIRLNGNH